ncbi:hypothetical protein CBA19CS91_01740 [Paraburkholderia hospita]|nr:hypothetical protein CBA19CS91_01740 [Paraburkholderia hospita]
MIKPSNGRVVWFTPSSQVGSADFAAGSQLAAIVAHVHSDRLVNLAVFDANGVSHSRCSVPLLQDDDPRPEHGYFAEWMPYQKGQAQKTEALEAQAQLQVAQSQPAVLSTEFATGSYSPDFGGALAALKSGKRVARAGWNGKGMWLALSCDGTREVPAANFWAPPNREYAEANGGTATVLPSITMKTATGEILMGWLASQTDMLAEDWTVVE